MNISIRPIRFDDAARVRELSEQLGYPATLEETEGRLRELLSLEHQTAFVAIESEKIIGWIYAFRSFAIESKPYIEIGGLVVDENVRGHGIGKRLIEKVKEWSLSGNIHELRVRTNIRRLESHEFYKAVGFRETKQQTVYTLPIQ